MVVGYEIGISSDNCAQKIAKENVYGRTVVKCPYADVGEMSGCLGGFLRQPVDQIRMHVVRLYNPTGTSDTQQIANSAKVHSEECVEHRGHEDGAARVRLG